MHVNNIYKIANIPVCIVGPLESCFQKLLQDRDLENIPATILVPHSSPSKQVDIDFP